MSRATLIYGDQRTTRRFDGVDVSEPVAGFYEGKVRAHGVRAGIKIWHGPPSDPVTGEELDRSWRWQAEVNGMPIDFDRVWPKCAGSKITAERYDLHCRKTLWARENNPDSAYADPRTKDISALSEPLPF
jgi:hypothetical protein